MKWKNKGHEFERFRNVFTWHKKIYIYGAGELGEDLYNRLKFVDCVEGFIDNRKETCMGRRAVPITEFLEMGSRDYIVIIAAGFQNMNLFKHQLLVNGFEEGKNLFLYPEFINFYMPIYFMYAWDRLYVKVISFLCTTKCNLNCISCLNFTSYNQKKKHYDIGQLKKDVDSFFSAIDYIDLFHVCGGEPFLYPHLAELLEYISQNYSHQIHTLATTTNATILPDDRLCRVMAENKISLYLDDYRENVPLVREKYEGIKTKLEQYKIKVIDNYVDQWLNLLAEKDSEQKSSEKLALHFSACNVLFNSLHNEKIYLCNYSDYAVEAGIVQEHENDSYSLTGFSDERRMELLEYMLGYSDRGYCELCKKCKGFLTINTDYCEVAQQERKV